MKNKINELLDLVKFEYLEKIAFFVLMFWTVSPLVEYIFKNYLTRLYTTYFSFIIRIIGFLGIIAYIIYFSKLYKEKKVKAKRFIPEILVLVLVIISFIASILSDDPHLSFYGEGYRREGLIVYIFYIGTMLLSSIIVDKKKMKSLLNSVVIICLIITILPLLKSDFTYRNFTNVFHNLNHYGYYLMVNIMLSAFLFIENKKILCKVLYLLVYTFFLYLLIRNDTFGCYLAIFLTLVVLFFYAMIKKYQRLNVIIVILVFIVTSFTVSHYDIKIGERLHFESTRGTIAQNILFLTRDIQSFIDNDEQGINDAGSLRGILWRGALEYTLEHPIIGGGMESVGIYYRIRQIGNSDRPHNIMLQASSSIGIPGALVYLGFILYIAIANLKLIGKDSIHAMIYFTAMCYFISSMFGNSMYYTSPYFVILLGLLIGFIRKKKLD